MHPDTFRQNDLSAVAPAAPLCARPGLGSSLQEINENLASLAERRATETVLAALPAPPAPPHPALLEVSLFPGGSRGRPPLSCSTESLASDLSWGSGLSSGSTSSQVRFHLPNY